MIKLYCKILMIFLSTFLISCHTTKKITQPVIDQELRNFAKLLIGKFSSEQQSITDTNYFNISLIMTPIWEDRQDGLWLYVEQAMATQKDKPYRQRVYKLTHPEKNSFYSDIYTLKDPKAFIELHKSPSKRQQLKPESIELKEGCTVILKKEKNTYKGGTVADHCPSDLRGASYATTKIELSKGLLISWDQGFDRENKQVWGATQGGYRFVKIE